MITDARIIEIRQQTKATTTTPWADTLAFAKALIAELEKMKETK